MVDEVQYLCDRIEALIADAATIAETGTTPQRAEQLERTTQAVVTLRVKGFPVPPDLLRLQSDLNDTGTLSKVAGQAMLVLKRRLADTAKLARRNGLRSEHNGARSWPRDATPLRVYREAIPGVLREAGGSASSAEVRERVFTMLRKRFVPSDFRPQATTGRVLWEYRLAWAAHQLRDQGVLRSDSPRGRWELAESRNDRPEEDNGR